MFWGTLKCPLLAAGINRPIISTWTACALLRKMLVPWQDGVLPPSPAELRETEPETLCLTPVSMETEVLLSRKYMESSSL